MPEHDFPTDEHSSGMDERRAQLVAAAEVIRAWAHERRATWSAEPLDIALAARATQIVEAATQLPRPAAADPEADDPPSDSPAAPSPVRIATARLTQTIASSARTLRELFARMTSRARALRIPDLREPLVRWSRRAGVVAALLAIMGSAWTARTYWPKLLETWPKLSAAWKLPARPKTGMAVLESVPAGSQVLVDGTVVGKTPLETELTAGRHIIEFRRNNAVTRKLEIDVTAGASTVGRVDWTARRLGRLHVVSVPPGAKVTVDGLLRGVTPQTIDDLTVGSHTVVLESVKGSVRKTVDIAVDRTAEINEAIYSGWLHVSSPIEVEITNGNRGIRMDERNQTLLPPGSYELQFENRPLGYRATRRVEVRPGEMSNVSIVPSPSALTVTATLPGEVFVDGERVGETPLTNHPVNLGTRDITVRSSSGIERRFTITVTVDPVRLVVDFSHP